MNTVADPDRNPIIGSQLPNPNECNSTLTSETRGETLSSNPNECHSMLTSAIREIYSCLYVYIYSLGIEYDFLTAPVTTVTCQKITCIMKQAKLRFFYRYKIL